MKPSNRDVRMIQAFAYVSTGLFLLGDILHQLEELIATVKHLVHTLLR
jgi:hypothetical protein